MNKKGPLKAWLINSFRCGGRDATAFCRIAGRCGILRSRRQVRYHTPIRRRDGSLFGPYQRDDSSGRRSRGKSLGWFQPFPTILTKRNVLPAVSQRHQTHIKSLGNSSIRPGYAGSLTILIEEVGTFEKLPSQKVLIKPSSRRTGSKLWRTRVPPKPPAETSQIPTALWMMYS